MACAWWWATSVWWREKAKTPDDAPLTPIETEYNAVGSRTRQEINGAITGSPNGPRPTMGLIASFITKIRYAYIPVATATRTQPTHRQFCALPLGTGPGVHVFHAGVTVAPKQLSGSLYQSSVDAVDAAGGATMLDAVLNGGNLAQLNTNGLSAAATRIGLVSIRS